MRILRFTFVLTVLFSILACPSVRASEEEYLQWRTVQIDCAATPETGKVSMTARADDKGLASLQMTAFGKTFTVTAADLRKISLFPLDSLKITHEAGYANLGGHTVHFKFQRNFYEKDQKLRSLTALVSISKGKGLEVAIFENEKP